VPVEEHPHPIAGFADSMVIGVMNAAVCPSVLADADVKARAAGNHRSRVPRVRVVC